MSYTKATVLISILLISLACAQAVDREISRSTWEKNLREDFFFGELKWGMSEEEVRNILPDIDKIKYDAKLPTFRETGTYYSELGPYTVNKNPEPIKMDGTLRLYFYKDRLSIISYDFEFEEIEKRHRVESLINYEKYLQRLIEKYGEPFVYIPIGKFNEYKTENKMKLAKNDKIDILMSVEWRNKPESEYLEYHYNRVPDVFNMKSITYRLMGPDSSVIVAQKIDSAIYDKYDIDKLDKIDIKNLITNSKLNWSRIKITDYQNKPEYFHWKSSFYDFYKRPVFLNGIYSTQIFMFEKKIFKQRRLSLVSNIKNMKNVHRQLLNIRSILYDLLGKPIEVSEHAGNESLIKNLENFTEAVRTGKLLYTTKWILKNSIEVSHTFESLEWGGIFHAIDFKRKLPE